MAPSINQNFTLRQGTKNTLEIVIVDENGNPKDIGAATAVVWTAAKDRDAADKLIQKSMAAGGIAFKTDGSDGRILVDIEVADIADMRGVYFHDAGVSLMAVPQIVTEGAVTIVKSQSFDP